MSSKELLQQEIDTASDKLKYGFQEIDCRRLADNPFQLIGFDWTLMTAEKGGVANTMTVAWGGLGFMWGKPAVFAAVRPERYTFEFAQAADTFSITSFDMADKEKNYRKMLAYLGTVSGRDENKIEKSGLTLVHEGGTPYFAESRIAMICKKIMVTQFTQEGICDQDFAKFYGGTNHGAEGLGGGFHYLYIAQITNLLVKEGVQIHPAPQIQSPNPKH